ncbi:hypothetical protein [Microbacterium sp. NIBRBAC000506063]|uniref:hypothetical protein n=1 Tax=Microbacterium sp. NIBRBAC000506063 TaxID=2734618 RepID=UPI002948BF5E|nr:hypothetical protein [Microbacterium sp. NIBRBAC000506063]
MAPVLGLRLLDLKDLEDPQGAMGDPESLHFLGKQGFAAEFPRPPTSSAGSP